MSDERCDIDTALPSVATLAGARKPGCKGFRTNRWRAVAVGAASLLASGLLASGTVEPATALTARLSNGMTLHTVATVGSDDISVRLLVPAGGRDDPRGKEGLAHYLEHLLAADPGVLGGGAAERGAPRLRAHGSANAFTSNTHTVYVMNVPRQSLELGLEVLAKRLEILDATEAVAEREAGVVRQEYFYRYGNNAVGRLWTDLGMQLGNTNPALGTTIGTPETIKKLDLASARSFFSRYYHPESMTLVLAGRFDAMAALAIAERTLGAIKQPPAATTRPIGAGRIPSSVVIRRQYSGLPTSTLQRVAFCDLAALDTPQLMRLQAALLGLRFMLVGGHKSTKGLVATIRDERQDLRALSLVLSMRDKHWLKFDLLLETTNGSARDQLSDLVLQRIGAIAPASVPPALLEDLQKTGDRAWRVPEDAPNADELVAWLALGFSVADRPAYKEALANVSAEDIAGLARRLLKPAVTATGYIDASR